MRLDHRRPHPRPSHSQRRYHRLITLIVVGAMAAAACGDGATTPTEESPPSTVMPPTTVAAPTTTTTPPTTMPETTTTTSTTSTTTTVPPTTTTVPPQDSMVLGTIQLGFVPAADGAVLPPAPLDFSLFVSDGNGKEWRVDFEDPDPGWALQEGMLSLTIRTFALPIPPGDYEIVQIELTDDDLAGQLFLVAGPHPHFKVLADAPCTFIGDMTMLYWRFPPGDLASTLPLAQELAGPNGATMVIIDGAGIMGGDFGIGLLDDVFGADVAGGSWWLDGAEVDRAPCVLEEATIST